MADETTDFDSRSQRVDDAFAAYLAAEDEGRRPDRDEFLARYPELRPDLEACLVDHENLARAIGHPSGPTEIKGRSSPIAQGAEIGSVGEYELLERIGEGGMGVVFKARQPRLNRIVALKILRGGWLASSSDVRRFQFEAEAVARLDHLNIVPVYEAGEIDGRYYFSMKFIEGASLADRVSSYQNDSRATARLMVTLARAMHHAHQRGIRHRDLKPSNILLDTENRPYVTDFGLAQRDENLAGPTIDGSILGTASYMSPEQAAGRSGSVTTAADVYGLGAIFYELLTGRPPFRGETVLETIRQVQSCEPKRPRAINPAVDRDLETICLKCLAKEPARRYGSADALANDLERWLRGEPTLARPISGPERLLRWCKHHPAAVTLVTLAVGSLIAATATAISVARAREAMLVSEVGRSNLYAARFAANTVLSELQSMSAPVANAANDARLRDLLARNDQPALQAYVEQLGKSATDSATGVLRPESESPFESWFVLDARGTILAVAPANPRVIGRDFRGRDYFRGALQHQGEPEGSAVHLSRVYRAENDGLSKFALAAPVCVGPKESRLLGVIATTITTTPTLGPVQLDDERRKVVLIGREDPNPPAGGAPSARTPAYVILRHPAYGHGEPARLFIAPQLSSIHRPLHRNEYHMVESGENAAPEKSIDLDHRDAIGDKDPAYAGRWVAGFAPVGNTELLVIVQQRHDATVELDQSMTLSLSLWGAIACALVVIIVAIAGYDRLARG